MAPTDMGESDFGGSYSLILKENFIQNSHIKSNVEANGAIITLAALSMS
jgi:hypothetical protein